MASFNASVSEESRSTVTAEDANRTRNHAGNSSGPHASRHTLGPQKTRLLSPWLELLRSDGSLQTALPNTFHDYYTGLLNIRLYEVTE